MATTKCLTCFAAIADKEAHSQWHERFYGEAAEFGEHPDSVALECCTTCAVMIDPADRERHADRHVA